MGRPKDALPFELLLYIGNLAVKLESEEGSTWRGKNSSVAVD